MVVVATHTTVTEKRRQKPKAMDRMEE